MAQRQRISLFGNRYQLLTTLNRNKKKTQRGLRDFNQLNLKTKREVKELSINLKRTKVNALNAQ